MFDGLPFDAGPLAQDVGGSAEVGVCRRHVAQALVVAGVVVVLDEEADLLLKVAGQEVVFQPDAVLQGVMPALDLALGLGMIGRAADVFHLLLAQPFGQVSGDVT